MNVKINKKPLGSDHLLIYISLSAEKSIYFKKSLKTHYKNVDWIKVASQLDESYTNFITIEYDNLSANEKYKSYVTTITDAIISNTSKKNYK